MSGPLGDLTQQQTGHEPREKRSSVRDTPSLIASNRTLSQPCSCVVSGFACATIGHRPVFTRCKRPILGQLAAGARPRERGEIRVRLLCTLGGHGAALP